MLFLGPVSYVNPSIWARRSKVQVSDPQHGGSRNHNPRVPVSHAWQIKRCSREWLEKAAVSMFFLASSSASDTVMLRDLLGNIQFNEITVLHQGKWAANRGLR